ncbi:MAG: carbohydrate binding family 9 domain-containing protein [Bacteroidales bacterium]|nr:carbohydrate binding family 9 domain-containing protein [Bacteroidales bacterium]
MRNRLNKRFTLPLFLLIIPNLLFGNESDTLTAHFIQEKIKIDGVLDEAAWSKAIHISDFTQREMEEGKPATEKTEIAILYTNNKLYIGVWAYDSEADKIKASQMNRDFSWGGDDNVEIILSPFNDNRNGYLFVTNPNGARADVLVSNEGEGFNKSWNGIWDVATSITEEGWFAEFEIPFSTLKFPKQSEHVWALNIERNIRHKREQVMWKGWSRQFDIEKISQAGKLDGLKNIQSKEKIELKPYITAGLEKTKGDPTSGIYNFGGDVNIDITPTLKLNLTANTDFGQVEDDQAQINLSRFSLYYSEKREFFLDGNNQFQMNVGGSNQLFYSRRIGNDSESEQDVPIIVGARIFGKQNRTNIGFLNIQTAAKDSVLTTNFSVLRISQDIWDQSTIGFIVTSKLQDGHQNLVYGADFNFATSSFLKNKNLEISGSVAQSMTSDSLNKDNTAYDLSLSFPNDWIELDLSMNDVQAKFNPEMGYIRRNNAKRFSAELQFNPRPKFLPFARNLEIKPIEIDYYFNSATNHLESINYEWRPLGIRFKSGEFIELNVQHNFDRLTESFDVLDTILIPVGDYWDNRMEVQFNTYSGRKVYASVEASSGEFYTGRRNQLETSLYWNANKHWNLSANWAKNYLYMPQGDAIATEISARVSYAYNPKLNGGLFGQWNSEDEQVLLNFRFNWIPKIGSDFYFIVNQELSTANNKIALLNTTVMAKFVWRFAI